MPYLPTSFDEECSALLNIVVGQQLRHGHFCYLTIIQVIFSNSGGRKRERDGGKREGEME